MRIKCISCASMEGMVKWCAARSPHEISLTILPIGLHDRPRNLRAQLQHLIDETDPWVDAVTLAYGLCGNAIAGLTTTDLTLVIPRAHDCVTLHLGSRSRYSAEFSSQPGTYWFTEEYLKGEPQPDEPGQVMDSWKSRYRRAVFIRSEFNSSADAENRARVEAEKNHWEFQIINTNPVLIQGLLAGGWNEDFLVLHPGQRVVSTADDCIITSEMI